MNGEENRDALLDFAAFVAIDWADRKHAFSIQAAGQSKKETGMLEQKPEIIAEWVAKLRERFPSGRIAVGIEQSRGALINALLTHDCLVIYPIHPTTVASFRQAFKFSGAKSDPLDTEQILEILTKHLELLRPWGPDTEESRLLARLVEHRRKTVDLRTGHVQALQAALKEYFPQALEAVNRNVSSRMAADLLKKWPTFALFQQAKPETIRRFLYGHNVRRPETIEAVLRLAEKSKALTEDGAIVESGWRLAQMHAEVIQTLNEQIAKYEKRIQELADASSERALFEHVPGAGKAMLPRLIAFFGTDRSRFDNAAGVQSFCGIAPVTVSSGRSKVVHCRRACPHFARQTFHELARLSIPECQWARNYVEHYTAQGKKYHTIIRALAAKWIRILFRCWKDRTAYDEEKHMEALKKRGSIFATLHLNEAR